MSKEVKTTLASTRPRRALVPKEPKTVTFSPDAKNNNGRTGPNLRRSTRNGLTNSPNYKEQLHSDEFELDEETIHESSMDMLLKAASHKSGGLETGKCTSIWIYLMTKQAI